MVGHIAEASQFSLRLICSACFWATDMVSEKMSTCQPKLRKPQALRDPGPSQRLRSSVSFPAPGALVILEIVSKGWQKIPMTPHGSKYKGELLTLEVWTCVNGWQESKPEAERKQTLLNRQAFLLPEQLVMELHIIVAIILLQPNQGSRGQTASQILWSPWYILLCAEHWPWLLSHTTKAVSSFENPTKYPRNGLSKQKVSNSTWHLASGHHSIIHEAGGKAPASGRAQGSLTADQDDDRVELPQKIWEINPQKLEIFSTRMGVFYIHGFQSSSWM